MGGQAEDSHTAPCLESLALASDTGLFLTMSVPGAWNSTIRYAQMCVSAYVFKQSGQQRTEAGNGALIGILFTLLWAICQSAFTGFHRVLK